MATSDALQKVVAAYVEERRQEVIDGFTCDLLPHLTRHTPQVTGMEGIVLFAALPPGEEAERIQAEIDYFAQRGLGFEWKVYDFDEPADLKLRLAQHGLECGESEAFMLYETAQTPSKRSGVAEIRRVENQAGLRDVVHVQKVVWQQEFDWLLAQLGDVVARRPEEISVYCAYVDDEPIGSGWTSFSPGSRFPELHGGAVVPEWRGRGVYGDLYRIRCEEVAARGFQWTAVDATDMSRPILEKLGFQFVCMTHPMMYQSA